LHEVVAGKTLEVSHESFWQSHIKAPEVLTAAVLDFAQLQPGEHVLDLYGGVGLFTAAIIDVVGDSGHVDLIEGSKVATEDARRNFSAYKNVTIATGDVAKLLPRVSAADVVVLDPPREECGQGCHFANNCIKSSSNCVCGMRSNCPGQRHRLSY
jgi:tRNA/tmRNA/rRNA uracil-C5-methylase (TrmA/RlmC/RlmD family)